MHRILWYDKQSKAIGRLSGFFVVHTGLVTRGLSVAFFIGENMTVKELQDFLERFTDDTEVKIKEYDDQTMETVFCDINTITVLLKENTIAFSWCEE